MYFLSVSGYSNPLAANTQLLFSSLLENNNFPSPVLISHFLLIWNFIVESKCPNIFASDFGWCAIINYDVSPGHIAQSPFFTALINVDLTGLKHIVCKKLASSDCVFFS